MTTSDMGPIATGARSAILWAVATFAISCHASPQEFPLQMLPGANVADGKRIADYPGAIDAILRVMVHKFNLPVPRGTLEVYATREGFEQALIGHLKIAPDLARTTARFAKSAVGNHKVLVNEQAVADSSWPQRIELLAHELTHTVQGTLANRPGLAHHQWLIEGSAEWMAFNVTDALGLDDVARARARMTDQLRELQRKRELPRLLRLDSFADWVAARNKYGFEATYSLSFLVTDFLIGRHSLSAVMDYFRRFQRSEDHVENFNAAFGEGLDNFERALEGHLDRSLK